MIENGSRMKTPWPVFSSQIPLQTLQSYQFKNCSNVLECAGLVRLENRTGHGGCALGRCISLI